jgi:hypothetical protein
MTQNDLAGIGGRTAEAVADPAAAPELRAAFIAGLVDLACFLEAHPELPVQLYGQEITLHAGYELPCDGTWEGALRALDAFAAAVGATVTETGGGHYRASRSFGPITYGAVAISPQARARHRADSSYYGCVQADGLGEVA